MARDLGRRGKAPRNRQPDIKFFHVDEAKDWNQVVTYLKAEATNEPLTEPDSVNYSKTMEEIWQRIEQAKKAGRMKELTKYSVAVIYGQTTLISIVFTVEVDVPHLSIVEVTNGGRKKGDNGPFKRLADDLAIEAATVFLGSYEERIEGAIPEVRHFYRMGVANDQERAILSKCEH
jgi:hypothetical protein